MFRNYLKIAYRNIIRQKVFSFINIFGLTLGLACSLFILLWVQDELNYDRFHDNLEQIYKVEEDQHYSGEVYHVNVTPYPSGPVWRDNIPEITEAVRYQWAPTMLVSHGDMHFYENGLVTADSSIFSVFSFPLLKGNPETALNEPYSIVLTEEMAEKYFGEEDPMFKTIMVGEYNFTVKGIARDVPANSSMQFDFLTPFDFIKKVGNYSDQWGSNSIRTYLLLNKNVDLEEVNQKLTAEYHKHEPDGRTDFMVAPLKRIHLYSYFGYDHRPQAIKYVYIFSVIGLFVLVIACINFMNLTTARSSIRSKEIGLRKVVGGKRINLIGQFYGESIIMALIAMVLAFVLVLLLIPTINTLSGKELTYLSLMNGRFIAGALVITMLAGFLAGSYPALFLSSFRPVQIMKGELGMGMKKGTLRKVLVVLQFSLSIFLIIGTLVIYKQLDYMKKKELGYDKENLLYLPMRGEIKNAFDRIKGVFAQNSNVLGITASTHPPNLIGSNAGGAQWPGKEEEMQLLITYNGCDIDFIETMKIEVAKGRNFSTYFMGDKASDTLGNFLINEELARIIGHDSIIGMPFNFLGVSGQIVGIVKDYHYQPVSRPIEPMGILLAPLEFLQYIIIRIGPGDMPEILSSLEETWKEVLPTYPFEYKFVNEDLNRFYRSQERMGSLLKYFTIIAILVACMGLFGLASFTAEQRTKEFGIRKAMGSSGINIIYLLTREFSWLVMISIVIGGVSAWYFMGKWLEDFAYRSAMHWWLFALSALLAMIIALVTVSYQSIKASRTNPSDSLRYE